MQANWNKAIESCLVWEGEWTGFRKQEPGGYAMRGVSMETYRKWCREKGKPAPTPEDLKNHPLSETKAIYAEMYGNRIGFDALPSGYDLMSLHCAIMFGPGRGKEGETARPGWADLNDIAKGDIGLLNALMMRAKMHRPDVGPHVDPETGKFLWLGKGWSDRLLAVYELARGLEQSANANV